MLCPTTASAASTIRPALSSASPSSFSEHIMPKEATPRTLACLISMPGSFAPTSAHGAFMPTVTFCAPHTMVSGSACPTSTVNTFKRSASGCLSLVSTCATTTFSKAGATGTMASTSSPAMVNRCDNSSLDSEGFTKVRNQDSENCISVKLFQELQIIFKEQSEIIYAVAQHGQAFHAHTEGETDVFFAVDADMLEYVRMHHAAAADLEPAAFPAHIHLGRRLGERKERWTEAHLHIFSLEIVLQEIGDHAFEVGEAHALADPQTFHLMEHWRMGCVGIDAIYAPWSDDANIRHRFQML